jgi:hypothetical protein
MGLFLVDQHGIIDDNIFPLVLPAQPDSISFVFEQCVFILEESGDDPLVLFRKYLDYFEQSSKSGLNEIGADALSQEELALRIARC